MPRAQSCREFDDFSGVLNESGDFGVGFGSWSVMEGVFYCLKTLLAGFQVWVEHLYKKVNRLAHILVNYAFSLLLRFHFFDSRPDSVTLVVLKDVNESALT